MKLIGSGVDGNGSQLFLLTDASRATGWGGAGNGPKKSEPEGSHWASAFETIFGAEDEPGESEEDADPTARTIEVGKANVDVLSFGTAGWIHVLEVDDGFVLVDGCYEDEHEVKSLAGTKESVPKNKAFETYVTSAPSKKAIKVHEVAASSGWLVLMSSTAAFSELRSGKKPAQLEEIVAGEKAAVKMNDRSGGHALFFRVAKKKYEVWIEPEVERAWGSAARVILRAR